MKQIIIYGNMINYQAFPKPTKIRKVSKKISPIGKRTRERISLHGTESDLHDEVWNKRDHHCEVCHHYIHNNEKSSICFAHRLWKGMYKAYRYLPDNIALVCSVACHHKIDKLYQGNEEFQINNRKNLVTLFDNLIRNETAVSDK